MQLSLKIAGPAGLGFNSLGVMLGNIFAKLGYFVIGDPEYSSRIKGGVNCFNVFISDTNYFISEKFDIVMPFDSANAHAYMTVMKPHGLLIANTKLEAKIQDISSMKHFITHNDKFDNIYFLGILGNLFRVEQKLLMDEVDARFSQKPEVCETNHRILQSMYDMMLSEMIWNHFNHISVELIGKAKSFQHGNAFIADGAAIAGLTYYAAYPMTPASSLLVDCAKHPNITVLQPEDEIAVANSVLGAHFAGARAMCGTSGGGLALMSEALSFADQAEIGGVFVLSSRAGPSTGTPTFNENADIDFALTPTFGGIRHIVMAPADPSDAFILIQHALNHADDYQIPVIFLVDKQLSESYVSYDEDLPVVPIRRGKLIMDDLHEDTFARYALTEDSVSPRTIPGVEKGDFIATSYEHDEYGATSEDRVMKEKMTAKRFHKTDTLFTQGDIRGYEILHPGAEKMLVVAGMVSMIARTFVDEYPEYGLIIIRYMKPFDERIREEISHVKELIFLEMNYGGQLQNLFMREVGTEILRNTNIRSIRKFDLLPFTLELIKTELL